MSKTIVKTIQSLVAERRALADREQRLLAILSRALAGFGYQLVPAARAARTAGPRKRVVAARGETFVCPHCSRRFSRAMHLGRHLAALHGEKGGARTARRRRARRKPVARRARRGAPAAARTGPADGKNGGSEARPTSTERAESASNGPPSTAAAPESRPRKRARKSRAARRRNRRKTSSSKQSTKVKAGSPRARRKKSK